MTWLILLRKSLGEVAKADHMAHRTGWSVYDMTDLVVQKPWWSGQSWPHGASDWLASLWHDQSFCLKSWWSGQNWPHGASDWPVSLWCDWAYLWVTGHHLEKSTCGKWKKKLQCLYCPVEAPADAVGPIWSQWQTKSGIHFSDNILLKIWVSTICRFNINLLSAKVIRHFCTVGRQQVGNQSDY